MQGAAELASASSAFCEHRWLQGPFLASLRAACEGLLPSAPSLSDVPTSESRSASKYGSASTESSELITPAGWAALPAALLEACRLFERLRVELGAATGRSLLDQVSVTVVSEGSQAPRPFTRVATTPCLARRCEPSTTYRSLTVRLDVARGDLSIFDHGSGSGDATLLEAAPAADTAAGLRHVSLVCTLYEGVVARYHRSGAVNLASVVLLDDHVSCS